MGSGGLHGDVAIAVAAALSPRATQAQTQALAGVFGGGGFVGADGMLLKQSCARRVTWGSIDENQTPTKVRIVHERGLKYAAPGYLVSVGCAVASRLVIWCL